MSRVAPERLVLRHLKNDFGKLKDDEYMYASIVKDISFGRKEFVRQNKKRNDPP